MRVGKKSPGELKSFFYNSHYRFPRNNDLSLSFFYNSHYRFPRNNDLSLSFFYNSRIMSTHNIIDF